MSGGFSFRSASASALRDANLQAALGVMKRGFIEHRAAARSRLPEFESLRLEAESIRNDILANLDGYLLRYESAVKGLGGHVHWARDSVEARGIVLDICRRHGARVVTKSKSMVGEEIAINEALESAGIEPVETDLGEYIIYLRGERPSHIIAPALHVLKSEVADSFRLHHRDLAMDRDLSEGRVLVGEARRVLRRKYFAADIGITGANFLLASTGSSVIVTNEGNGDLTQLLPRVHIVLASLDKVVGTFNDAWVFLRLLARSATGQELSSYTSFTSGPRRAGELDGAEEYHVILLDNGRSEILGSSRRSVLRCIRCGACMNHCPVYAAIGGHAYGSVYPGPIGSALSPGLDGLGLRRDLPHASSFCGRCEEVCPVRIPLTEIMRSWRQEDFVGASIFRRDKFLLGLWVFLVSRIGVYRYVLDMKLRLLSLRWVRRFMYGLGIFGGWSRHRELPIPQRGLSFLTLYKRDGGIELGDEKK